MKKYLKKILERILFIFARAVLKKYEPKVVGITGSIGKSSAKEAIFAVLNNKFRARQNIKNYNNEIGLPLTIIGEQSGGRSIKKWLRIFWSAIKLIVKTDQKYPEVLILEMGVDHPGDMEYLTALAPVDIGIITNIGPVHLEYFKTIEKVAREKATLVIKLKPGGWGVLNADNETVLNLKNSVRGRFLTFGFSQEAMVSALEIDLSYKRERVSGISFKLRYQGAIVPVFLPNILADHLVYAALAAGCVAIILEMNLVEIAEALQKFSPPLGRMHLLDGINDSQIIDDSYNASPEAVIAAVETLDKIKCSGRKIAVLGDMLELGDYERTGHELVGQAIAELGINQLVIVGERAKIIASSAIADGFNGDGIKYFDESIGAGDYLLHQVKPGDLLLIKGSQGMRMERTTKILLADPSRAESLLVRQEGEWLNK
jgi:UDP-N-acetylmuramoyl-tripeptide--D-alanyl-D-alanine ligase